MKKVITLGYKVYYDYIIKTIRSIMMRVRLYGWLSYTWFTLSYILVIYLYTLFLCMIYFLVLFRIP